MPCNFSRNSAMSKMRPFYLCNATCDLILETWKKVLILPRSYRNLNSKFRSTNVLTSVSLFTLCYVSSSHFLYLWYCEKCIQLSTDDERWELSSCRSVSSISRYLQFSDQSAVSVSSLFFCLEEWWRLNKVVQDEVQMERKWNYLCLVSLFYSRYITKYTHVRIFIIFKFCTINSNF
jgi:hypothetical protein